jgi:hypothetical protein
VVVANTPSLVTGAVTRQADVPALWAGRSAADGPSLRRLDGAPLGVLELRG